MCSLGDRGGLTLTPGGGSDRVHSTCIRRVEGFRLRIRV